jgi:hypothetical protein
MTRLQATILMFTLGAFGCDCEGKMLVPGDGGDAASDGTVTDGATDAPMDGDVPDGAIACVGLADPCAASAECCGDLVCDPGSGTCVSVGTGCGLSGAACSDPSDCCSGSCPASGLCATTCTQNTMTCADNGDCCSGNCVNDVCVAAAGTICTTTGNVCTIDANCCSNNCSDGVCSPTGGSCAPFNDTCYSDDDCCSARCTENGSGVGGVCVSLGVGGTGSCEMAGEPCDGCAGCCSRTCVPTATGASICLRASGCALESELCQTDDDCCGSEPSGAGTQTCSRANIGDEYGRCVLSGNTPDGNVCKSATPICEASIAPSNCGNCEAPKEQCCRIDSNGTPRCFGGSTADCPAGYDGSDPNCCIATGNVCNFSDECCGGAPCLPDNMGTLRCGAGCSVVDAPCRASNDCCLGLMCNIPPGETVGTCNEPVTPPPTDGGTPPVCSQYGQACSATQACCDGVSCSSPVTGGSCGALETGCSCFVVIE